MTHLLVRGFDGSVGDDLDVDDDGVLDAIPWLALLDAVALVEEENPPSATELSYVLDERIGPDAGQVSGHVQRCPDGDGALEVAAFDPAAGSDTPGTANACAPVIVPLALRIPEIQGAGHVSPFEGQRVTTRGVVIATDSNGYYLQDVAGDGDLRTSDALLVFTGSASSLAVGDVVEVTATVAEFVPGGAASGNLSITELVSPSSVTVGTARIPPATVLGASGRQPPTEIIDDDAFAVFDPERDGIDFFESLEGMRVTLSDVVTVSGTNRFGEVFTVLDRGKQATGLSVRGTLNVSPRDFNPERVQIQVDPGIFDQPIPQVDAGARLGEVTGVMSYAFGNYEVLLSEPVQIQAPSSLVPERTKLQSSGKRIRVASFNVLNLDPNDDDGDADVGNGRFDAIGRIIARDLRAPEIVALQEVQDNDGSVRSSIVAADRTLRLLVDAIASAGGPRYAWIDHPFIGNETSGGQPGGNIRVAYLYDPRRVEWVPQSLATVTDPIAQQADPRDPFFRTRLPLVTQFRIKNTTLTVVNVHLSSKGGSAPLFGRTQPAMLLQEDPSVNGGVDARRRQALQISSFIDPILDFDPTSNVVVLGDFNEFEFVSPLAILGEKLMNLTWTLPEDERYTFVFEGNSQSLDHVLVSPSLRASAQLDIVHVNSERAETDPRASDHDPLVARIELEPKARSRNTKAPRR